MKGRDLLSEVECAARAGGSVLESFFGRVDRDDATHKGGRRRDLVSAADLASEAAIRERVPETDGLLAEEGAGRESASGLTWVVDPLDGTINFLHRLPLWAVSIAVLDDAGPVAAAIHAPALGWTFSARRGQGAFEGKRRLSVSGTTEIEDAILATGFPYARDTLADNNLENVPRVGRSAGGLRRLGSAALDLALVASGRLDGFWELHLEPWDIAAGILIVRESGGRVTDFAGDDTFERLLTGRNLVATNGHVHEPLRGALAPLRELGATAGA